MQTETKIMLDENDMPDRWYNIQADLPSPPLPPLNPQTFEPLKPEELSALFPKELIRQEMSRERWIPIPEEVKDIYRLWRPSPLYRARRLERALKTPARIYYKWEGVSPPGSHKPNTAVAQAYYNAEEGIERLTTETGAGQWGSSLAFATSFFDMKCTVYMVRISYEQKPYRKVLMQTWGAEVIPSPSTRTQAGKQMLEQFPETTGSLGMAISEAVEDAATHENAHYALGSVLNHVSLHQTIIGLEMKKQFESIDEYPDAVFGCVGGGSNFSGGSFPFIMDILNKKSDVEVVACEPMACPTLTKGIYRYDFGDTAGLTPLLKMYTLGHTFVPPGIHAGGLRYHGDAPLLCQLVDNGYVKAKAFYQNEVFEAAELFARTEGFVIAPESAHGLKGVIDEARECKKTGEEKVLCFVNSGHGHFDLSAYDSYNSGQLVDYEYPSELIQEALKNLPEVESI
ncbi:MAG: TrpB-like pyridoxal phosphate-dependent enzyme [Thermoplasmata archaeon]|nr:MAG: TrpB-like pyridoxal phosphate-dependent enzyme [Thermoplasmata archaeon]